MQNIMANSDWHWLVKLFPNFRLVLIQKPSFRLIVHIANICYSDHILMKFNRNIIYIEKIWCSKFGYNILTNNRNRPIVRMTAIRYICSIQLVSTHIQSTVIRNMYTKFQQDCFKTKRLINVATDGQMNRRTYGQTDCANSTPFLIFLIQNIYTL